MLKRSQLTWVIVGIVVISALIIGYLVYSRKKEGYSQQDVEQIHAALKMDMARELEAIRDNEGQLVEPPDVDDVVPSGRKGAGGVIALFYSKTCPPCVNMMGDWDKFKSNPDIQRSDISVREFEGAETIHHQVEGTPTIRYYPPGRFPDPSAATKYNGDRSAGSFVKFALSRGQQV